ncbi:MAG: putative LPS assembly protein LptD [Bacteroidales bacterium]
MHNNKSIKLFKQFFPILLSMILSVFLAELAQSQETSSIPDSIYHNSNTPVTDRDTLIQLNYQEISQDTLVQDTITGNEIDTLQARPPASRQNNFLSSEVEYTATDSIVYSVTDQKFFLWGEAYVKYENLELRAHYIEIDMASNEVFATGIADSLGQVTGRPVMTEGSETFEAETMRYNFQTKKGIITGIVTEQQDGFLHGHTTKKHANDHLHIHGGKYTTCDLDHPHFYIALTRAKVIPDDKVISGPAYLVIEDIPLPVAVPFGFFPNKPENKSGILFPTYGEEVSRGFYLRNGGYYLHLNEYMDLRLMGDVYSLGSWAVNAASNYSRRYRFNGSFRYAYSYNVTGERGLAGYMENNSYNIAWQHRQDAKASPNSNFTASVNFGSSSHNKFNTINPDTYATNTAQSSISFSQRWPDSPFSLTSNVSANQNFSDNSVTVRLPSVNFNMARQYPFRSAQRVGEYRWYENIELSYTSNLDNRINTKDSLLFKRETLGNMESGFRHEIPLRANFRLLNLLNITPGISYSGVMYTKQIRRNWVDDYVDPRSGEIVPGVVTDTIPGIVYGHAINPNFSTSLSQNIYGMFTFRNSRVEAIRHVMTPSVGFSFIPDMGGINPDYYRTVQANEQGRIDEYSIFQGQMYGTPSVSGRAGNVSISLLNNLEMKVRDQRDTINQSRKVPILERLNFSTSYNIYADSMNWSVINMTGSTSVFENKVRINFNAIMDPYAIDENNRRYNSFQWSNNRTPGRITRAGLSLTMGLKSAVAQRPSGDIMEPGASPVSPDGTAMPRTDAHGEILPGEDDIFGHLDDVAHEVYYYGDYVDFSVPWNLNVRYNLNYTRPQRDSRINQTLNFSGDLSLTPRWKIQFTSGYDFEAMDFTMTNINIYRDLHCWDMRFGVVPFGSRKSWNFSIAVKSSLLKDLKYRTTRSWYDNFFN